MALMNKGIAPHRLEPWLKFAAGFAFGAVISGLPLAIGWPFSRGLYALAVGCSGLAFGLVARPLGDRFWHTMRDWLWLFWP